MGEHLGADVGAQVAGDRIDGLVFLFDADVECGLHVSTLPRGRNCYFAFGEAEPKNSPQ